MQRGKKNQGQIQPPLYIKGEPEEVVEETLKEWEDHNSTFYDEEGEGVIREESNLGHQVSLDDGEIEEYYKKFTNFMQAELHKIENLKTMEHNNIK